MEQPSQMDEQEKKTRVAWKFSTDSDWNESRGKKTDRSRTNPFVMWNFYWCTVRTDLQTVRTFKYSHSVDGCVVGNRQKENPSNENELNG